MTRDPPGSDHVSFREARQECSKGKHAFMIKPGDSKHSERDSTGQVIFAVDYDTTG